MAVIRVIHQTWKDSTPPDELFRSDWVDSWKRHNPSWEYRLWTDEEIQGFVRDEFPEFYPVWRSYPKHIMRVDAWRYLLLQRCGGFYVDLDVAALRPLDPWIANFQQFACADQGDGNLCNALMWAPEARAPFLNEILDAMTAAAYFRDPLYATGPRFLQRYASSRMDLVSQIPTAEVFPITVWDRRGLPEARRASLNELSDRFERAVTVSFWTGSWTSQTDTIVEESAEGGGNHGLQIKPQELYFAVIPDGTHTDLLKVHKSLYVSSDGPVFRYWAAAAELHAPGAGVDLQVVMEDFLESGRRWAFVCTEATYVVPERIGLLLDQEAQLVCNEALLVERKLQRRAGYVVARRLAEQAVAAGTVHTDDDLAHFVSEREIPIKVTPLLRHDRYRYPAPGNSLVSAAFDDPRYFLMIPDFMDPEKITSLRCAHQYWAGDLQFTAAGGCRRPATGCHGTWKFLHGGHRLIDWFEWPQEVLFSIGENLGFVADAGHATALLDLLPLPDSDTAKRKGQLVVQASDLPLPEIEVFRVPRIIHQTWRTREMPPFIERCTHTVRDMNPGWEYRFYTDLDWNDLVADNPFFEPREFWEIPTGIQRADVARMLALYRFGGAYLDVDILACRPLDSLMAAAVESGLVGRDTQLILATDHPVHCQFLFSGSELLMNHFMIAVPQSKFVGLYLSRVMSRISAARRGGNLDPVQVTGPLAITELVEGHGGPEELGLSVFPYFWTHPLPDMTHAFPGREAFDKVIRDGTWKDRFCPFFVHCWWHTYHSDNNMMAEYGSYLLGNSALKERWSIAEA